jgi:hypothetical protein
MVPIHILIFLFEFLSIMWDLDLAEGPKFCSNTLPHNGEHLYQVKLKSFIHVEVLLLTGIYFLIISKYNLDF